jgi:hypothetical protein
VNLEIKRGSSGIFNAIVLIVGAGLTRDNKRPPSNRGIKPELYTHLSRLGDLNLSVSS